MLVLSNSVVAAAVIVVDPANMRRVTTIDERFQSYNVEMAEVVGGNFWKPYPKPTAGSTTTLEPGHDSALFEKRDPIDLTNAHLRKLAAALGPAYVRVSGTWANSVYFQDDDDPVARKPPDGFQSVLTRAQWSGVFAFAKAVDAEVVTSFAISAGVRDAQGVWTPVQARRRAAFTKSIDGRVAAAALFNEPTVAASGGAPDGYDAAMYARDEAAFRAFVARNIPDTRIAGPGSAGEGGVTIVPRSTPTLHSNDLLAADPMPRFDVFSYHFYGALSKRCESFGPRVGTTPERALTEAWLSKTDAVFDFYKTLQATYAPNAPIWITETADAACGGNPWASTFLDTFRYIDQMGRLAKRGVKVIFHNTLAASDYGLIDEDGFRPRPSYWAALLWRRLMGTVVLDAGDSREGMHIYAHCLRGRPGGVALLAINNSRTAISHIDVPAASERYTLSAERLQSASVRLNGEVLELRDDELPPFVGVDEAAGEVELMPATITFLAVPDAGNPACG